MKLEIIALFLTAVAQDNARPEIAQVTLFAARKTIE
jgi:hypothetical protein